MPINLDSVLTATPNPGAASVRPETFRLPKAGQRDPYFGLPRTTYYELEKAGTITFLRLRKRGNMRGTTLIPFDQMLAYVRGLRPIGDAI
ncbi:MAG: hypothetical protein QOI04_1571 [Verrucomicrobiota bacterium]|jgi:hypothetical protein